MLRGYPLDQEGVPKFRNRTAQLFSPWEFPHHSPESCRPQRTWRVFLKSSGEEDRGRERARPNTHREEAKKSVRPRVEVVEENVVGRDGRCPKYKGR